MLRGLFEANKRENLAFYSLASLANLFLSVPQFQAVNNAIQLGIRPQGVIESMVSQYGPLTGLLLEFATEILVFQGIVAVFTIGLSVAAYSRSRRKWQYWTLSILIASYLAYHLGGKFLNALGWISVLETSGSDVSGVYGNLFWFGLFSVICYLVSILLLRRSYGNPIPSPRAIRP